VLLLLRFGYHAEVSSQQRDLLKPESQLLRERKRNRSIMHAILYLAAIGSFVAGRQGWELNGLSATFFGIFLLVYALLGHCNVNIWFGGPLDPRNDPVEHE